jgi:hypothetical protein
MIFTKGFFPEKTVGTNMKENFCFVCVSESEEKKQRVCVFSEKKNNCIFCQLMYTLK